MSWGTERARVWRARLTPWEQATLDAALEHERRHGSDSHPAHWRTREPPAPVQA